MSLDPEIVRELRNKLIDARGSDAIIRIEARKVRAILDELARFQAAEEAGRRLIASMHATTPSHSLASVGREGQR